MKKWISAIRPRTLPLAIAGILMGTFTAIGTEYFDPVILTLALLTAISLQVLSNLANDYGDFEKGTDSMGNRSDRALASGNISPASMKRAVILSTVISFVLGIGLLIYALGIESKGFLILLVTGLLAIGAAIKYTVGKTAYGYHGLGDLAVLIFFGVVAVSGSYYLYCPDWWMVLTHSLFPGLAVGLLSVGVLNINNIRDINADRMNGKRTLAVIMGREGAIIYQALLVILAFAMVIAQWWAGWAHVHWFMLIPLPLYTILVFKLAATDPNDMEAHHKILKFFVLLTLLFVVFYGVATLM